MVNISLIIIRSETFNNNDIKPLLKYQLRLKTTVRFDVHYLPKHKETANFIVKPIKTIIMRGEFSSRL